MTVSMSVLIGNNQKVITPMPLFADRGNNEIISKMVCSEECMVRDVSKCSLTTESAFLRLHPLSGKVAQQVWSKV